jgi:hypothetical protein
VRTTVNVGAHKMMTNTASVQGIIAWRIRAEDASIKLNDAAILKNRAAFYGSSAVKTLLGGSSILRKTGSGSGGSDAGTQTPASGQSGKLLRQTEHV